MESLDKIKSLIAQVLLYSLQTSLEYKALSPETIQKTYNGCGPAWLPNDLRNKLTDWLGRFESAFMIHDCDYSFKENHDSSEANFTKANKRLQNNCWIIVKKEIAAHRIIKRFQLYLATRDIYLAVQKGGWKAWQEA